MIEIKVNMTGDPKKDQSALDSAIREFKKQVKKSGILNEIRRREEYMSPSKYKKYRRNEAIKRRKREEKKEEWNRNNQSDFTI